MASSEAMGPRGPMKAHEVNRLAPDGAKQPGVAGPDPASMGHGHMAVGGRGVTPRLFNPRLFNMSRFRYGIPAEILERITGMSLDELRRHVASITHETLAQAMALGIKSLHKRRVGKPRKLEITGGMSYLRLEPELAILAPTNVVMNALGVTDATVEAVHAMREAFKDSVRIVEITGMTKLGRGVIGLEAGRVYAVVVREAEPGEPEHDEAMTIINMLEAGEWAEALSMLFGIPKSHGLLRAFLPRFLTLIMPTRPYGHELATQACPTTLQIHPPGTGKSRFSDVMVNLMPSTAMVVGSASRVSMIYDGQLKAPGMVYKYRHVIWDEFATAPMGRDKARDLEGALKHGIISGERIRAAEGARGRMVKARNELYMRRFSNHVRVAKGSRIEYRPSSPHETLHEAVATIFGRLGFAEGMARARRFTRLDITRAGRTLDDVTDGMSAKRQPTGMVLHPKTLITVVSWLRKRPDILARRGILVKRGGKYMPRLRDEINTSSTLARLNDRRHDLVSYLTEARRERHEIPGTDMALEHAVNKPLDVMTTGPEFEPSAGKAEAETKDETKTKAHQEPSNQPHDPTMIEETVSQVTMKMARARLLGAKVRERHQEGHDPTGHVRLAQSAKGPIRVICIDDTCFAHRGPLTSLDKPWRDHVLRTMGLIEVHADMAESQKSQESQEGGDSHDERTVTP